MSDADFEYLGPYHVERLIGRGGMGSVYKGLHTRSGEPVAIKVIASGIANQPRFRRRFAAEIDALKMLRHPNIVSLIGYGEERGLLFYSMEYVAGQSLHELLRSSSKVSWQEAIQIGIETTAALKHAHNIGIIHRDLKPANLMLDSEGRVKLTDFGIAKLYGSTDETAVGAVIGTADYMPPEQAEGKTVTTRSDLYSLGCVMYALLAGKPPFIGKSVPEVLYAVRYSPVPDIRNMASDVPHELAELIQQLLEKDPQKRPPTALVVGNRLKAVQQALKGKASLSSGGAVLPSVGKRPSVEKSPPTQATNVGNKLTSLDMDDEEVQLTGREISELPMGDTASGRQLGTHEKQTVLASDSQLLPGLHSNKTSDPKDSELSSEHMSARHETSLQLSGSTHASVITSGGPSHYTPVEESNQSSYTRASESAGDPHRWDLVQMLSALGLVALLVASIAFVWWRLQPESADDIYQNIMLAAESGDESLLLGAGNLMAEFLARFPQDERAVEIEALSDEAELIRRVRLLHRKATRSGGVHELSAAEQGFLECMKTRSQDFSRGQEKLAAFISLFAIDNLDPQDARLVELATFAKNAATNIPLEKEPRAKVQLQVMIQSAEKSMNPEQLQRFYRNLLELYADKPWAKEQVQIIQERLQSGA